MLAKPEGERAEQGEGVGDVGVVAAAGDRTVGRVKVQHQAEDGIATGDQHRVRLGAVDGRMTFIEGDVTHRVEPIFDPPVVVPADEQLGGCDQP